MMTANHKTIWPISREFGKVAPSKDLTQIFAPRKLKFYSEYKICYKFIELNI